LKLPSSLRCFIVAALLVAVALSAQDLLNRYFPGGADISRRKSHELNDKTAATINNLKEPVLVTYYVTEAGKIPPELKHIESKTVAVLKRIRNASGGKFGFEIIDPTRDEGLQRLAAQKKASPVHIGKIRSDSRTEDVVWSTIVISMGGHRDEVIHHVTEKHLPYLESLIAGHLEYMSRPARPRIGISPPGNYSELEKLLGEKADVLRFDFDTQPDIPDVDFAFIFEPQTSDDMHRATLGRFIAEGGTALVAGSKYDIGMTQSDDGSIYIDAVPRPVSPGALLKDFGVSFNDRIVLDEKSEFLRIGGPSGETRTIYVPVYIRTTPVTHDFRNFASQSRGALAFFGASPVELNPKTLKKAGYSARNIVTTSEDAWSIPLSSVRLKESDFNRTVIESKIPLAVLLTPENPLQGRLIVFGSASIFRDDSINRRGFAHRIFIGNIERTFLKGERIVAKRIDKMLPEQIPEAGGASAGRAIFIILLLLPVLAAVFAVLKLGVPREHRLNKLFRFSAIAALLLIALISIGLISSLQSGIRVDLTSGNINSLQQPTISLLKNLEQGIEVEFIASDPHSVPNSLKEAYSSITALLSEMKRNSNGKLRIKTTKPAPDDESELIRLESLGVTRTKSLSGGNEMAHGAWCSLVFSGPKASRIVNIDEESLNELEFRAALAIKSIVRGRPFRVAVASDLPRLSPAEAYEDYFKKQLSAPVGGDVYSMAKKSLLDSGFEVLQVNPAKPVLPEGIDALIWLQPRRPVLDMGAALGNYLEKGGNAFVAMQHFNIQQRQYSGRNFKTVYWPQPQFMDLNGYLEILGVGLVREILMDNVQDRLELEMQINRSASREYESQAVAKPFVIKAIPPYFNTESAITKRLGNLLYIWGNWFSINNKTLSSRGISSEPLIETSPGAWDYEWNGGFLDDSVFTPGEVGQKTLAVLLEGYFPRVNITGETEPRISEVPIISSVERGKKGKLLLTGCSEMFKNNYLKKEGFSHEAFLLRAAAALAAGDEIASLLSKENFAQGFSRPGGGAALKFRIVVIALPCLLFIAAGLARLRPRKRK